MLGLPATKPAAAAGAPVAPSPATTSAKAAKAAKAAAAARAAAAKQAAAAKAASRRTVAGDTVEMERWGPVTVTITVAGGKIVEAKADLPLGKSRSEYINSRVGPYLNALVLQLQTAHVDIVSGATMTCEAYAQSLQSAIDRAGIKPAATATGT